MLLLLTGLANEVEGKKKTDLFGRTQTERQLIPDIFTGQVLIGRGHRGSSREEYITLFKHKVLLPLTAN